MSLKDVVAEMLRRMWEAKHRTAWLSTDDGGGVFVSVNSETCSKARAVLEREGLLCQTDLGTVTVEWRDP